MENRNNINLDGDVDVNFDGQFQTSRQVLQKYTQAIHALRIIAEKKYYVRPHNFDNYLLKYFQLNEPTTTNALAPENQATLLSSLLKIELLKHIRNRRRQLIYWLSYFFVAIILFFFYQDGLIFEGYRWIQDRNLVYPTIRVWRRFTIPVIRQFPRLTELYDESCLMENPFFQAELNCEPCSNVDSVVEFLDDEKNSGEFNENNSNNKNNKEVAEIMPFMFKINQSNINLQDFYGIYNKNQDIFRRDAYRVQSTNSDIHNLEELFYRFNESIDVHSLWRCNRMLPARLFRPLYASLFSSSRLPKTGIAMERFVSFDTPHAPTYILPDTNCANVYVLQLLGTRFIILRPTSECRDQCRTLSLRLPQSFVLSYNWWYWKPISAPDPVAENSSISLIGSYC